MLVLFRALYTNGFDNVGSMNDGALSPGLYSEFPELNKTEKKVTKANIISLLFFRDSKSKQ